MVVYRTENIKLFLLLANTHATIQFLVKETKELKFERSQKIFYCGFSTLKCGNSFTRFQKITKYKLKKSQKPQLEGSGKWQAAKCPLLYLSQTLELYDIHFTCSRGLHLRQVFQMLFVVLEYYIFLKCIYMSLKLSKSFLRIEKITKILNCQRLDQISNCHTRLFKSLSTAVDNEVMQKAWHF